jgi:hypothetical protein
MQNDLLISLLRTELAEREQEAAKLRKVAEGAQAEAVRLESLAASIRATLEGISGQDSKEQVLRPEQFRQLPTKSSTNGNGVLLDGSRAGPAIALGSSAGKNLSERQGTGSNSEPKLDSSRHPKDYQRPEYRGQRGYIQIAKKILEKHPEGLHIGQLVELIFEYQSSEEFTKAKRCLQAELMRGAKENRLLKEGDYYFSQPRTPRIATKLQSELSTTQNN